MAPDTNLRLSDDVKAFPQLHLEVLHFQAKLLHKDLLIDDFLPAGASFILSPTTPCRHTSLASYK
jgi:hypothetical protein